jgi:hypothetical protein
MSSNQLILALAIAFGSVGAASAATTAFEGGEAGNARQVAASVMGDHALSRAKVEAELAGARSAKFLVLEGGQAGQPVNGAQVTAGMALDRMAVLDALAMQQRQGGVQRVYEGGESSRVQ